MKVIVKNHKFLQAGCVLIFGILLMVSAIPPYEKPTQISLADIEPSLTAGASHLPLMDWRETEIIISEPNPQIIETAQPQPQQEEVSQQPQEESQHQEEVSQPVTEEVQDTEQSIEQNTEQNTEPVKEVKSNIPELYDFNLLALTVQAEGYTMGYTGMRYITSSIINLARDRGCSIDDVVTSGAYTVVNNGTIWRQTLYDDTVQAVSQEVYNGQIDTEIKYFRTGHYHGFGTPCFNWGNVYFSK